MCTDTPKGLISLRKASENATTPNFEMAYAAAPGRAVRDNTLPTFTILPLHCFSRGRKVLLTATVPHRLISTVTFMVSIVSHSVGPDWPAMPALLTTPHKPANTIRISRNEFLGVKMRWSKFSQGGRDLDKSEIGYGFSRSKNIMSTPSTENITISKCVFPEIIHIRMLQHLRKKDFSPIIPTTPWLLLYPVPIGDVDNFRKYTIALTDNQTFNDLYDWMGREAKGMEWVFFLLGGGAQDVLSAL